MTTTRHHHTARWHASRINNAAEQRNTYATMRRTLEALTTCASAPTSSVAQETIRHEIERLNDLYAELDATVDAWVEDAILDGYGPDDIDKATR